METVTSLRCHSQAVFIRAVIRTDRACSRTSAHQIMQTQQAPTVLAAMLEEPSRSPLARVIAIHHLLRLRWRVAPASRTTIKVIIAGPRQHLLECSHQVLRLDSSLVSPTRRQLRMVETRPLQHGSLSNNKTWRRRACRLCLLKRVSSHRSGRPPVTNQISSSSNPAKEP